jgi:protein-S-isoprenylcysteine O-methyltransferase Ste14
MSLLPRALLAFLLLPGVVAYLVPVLIGGDSRSDGPWRWLGAILVASGSALLLWCVVEFYRAGRGTLAPWAPPRALVTTGPYSRSRNPMYVAVLLVAAGWAAWFGSAGIALYVAVLAVAFHLRVVFVEERRLAAAFGEAWQAYARRVRRWL